MYTRPKDQKDLLIDIRNATIVTAICSMSILAILVLETL